MEIQGSAVLNKVDETAESSTWSFDELQILDNKVNFTEPVQITATHGANAGATEPPAAEEPKSAEPKEHQ